MFGRRADATLVRGLSTTRAFMPYVSPRRNDSVVYYTDVYDAEPALRLVEDYNRSAPVGRRLSLFLLFLRAVTLAIAERPALNRFVAGSRLWQRDELWITFSAKIELVAGSPVVSVKRRFDEDRSVAEMVDGILGDLERQRSGEESSSDRLMRKLMHVLPPPVIRAAVGLRRRAGELGLLTKSVIDHDPLFTSVFVANLGSLDMRSAHHHLWEYGTASIFAMMGRIEGAAGSRHFEIRYTYDERIEDGLYGGLGLQIVKDLMEHPEKMA